MFVSPDETEKEDDGLYNVSNGDNEDSVYPSRSSDLDGWGESVMSKLTSIHLDIIVNQDYHKDKRDNCSQEIES